MRDIYAELTDMDLPDEMPPRERRVVDCVLQRRGESPRIIEFESGAICRHSGAAPTNRALTAELRSARRTRR